MYNGIGLTTPRGSGSSGHVQGNKSHVRPEFFRDRVGRNQSNGGSSSQSWSQPQAMLKRGNDELLEHAKKRKVEAKIFELQEAMCERGYTDAEIEAKVLAVRQDLEGRVPTEAAFSSTKETHVAAANKAIENANMRSAFGLSNDYAEGEAFDEDAQQRRKAERAAARELRKEEQKKARLQDSESRTRNKEKKSSHAARTTDRHDSSSKKHNRSSRKSSSNADTVSPAQSPSFDDMDYCLVGAQGTSEAALSTDFVSKSRRLAEAAGRHRGHSDSAERALAEEAVPMP